MQDDTTAETPPETPGTLQQPAGQGNLAAQLGAAAIGSCGIDHYLSAFARLDAAGRAVPLWNGAAAAAGPAWLAFRALWRGLAVYAALALVLVAAVVFAQRLALLPGAVLAGVALALWLAGVVALGLWGDALVHRDVRRRIEAAVAQAATMQQAVQLLQSAAPTRRRAWLIAALGAVALAAAGVIGFLPWSGGERGPAAERGAAEVTGAVTVLPQPPAPPKAAQQAMPAPMPAFDANEAQAVQGETDAALAALEAQARETAAASVRKAQAAAAAHPAPLPRPKAAERPKRAKPAPAESPAPAVRKLYINVGIFADPANAARAHERLRREGLPASVDTLRPADGKVLQRVRVGPFTSAAQANEAAAKVRLLGLDAVPAAQ